MTTDAAPPRTHGPAPMQTYGVAFWVAVVVGWTVVIGAFFTIVVPQAGEQALRVAVWFVACNLAVDAVVMPLSFLAAKAGRRALPVRWRPPVAFAVATSAVLALFSWPAVRRYGERPDNPSVLPFDYAMNLAIVVGLVLAATAVVTAARHRLQGGDTASR